MSETKIKNAPEKIYLLTGLDEGELHEDVNFDTLHEVTWSNSKEFFHDIEYSLSTPAQPVPVKPEDEKDLEKFAGNVWDAALKWANQDFTNHYPNKQEYIKQALSSLPPAPVKAVEDDPINNFGLQALSVLSKVLHALQHSNMRGTILHDEIRQAIETGIKLPFKVKKS